MTDSKTSRPGDNAQTFIAPWSRAIGPFASRWSIWLGRGAMLLIALVLIVLYVPAVQQEWVLQLPTFNWGSNTLPTGLAAGKDGADGVDSCICITSTGHWETCLILCGSG
jgi:hypothetical protein